MGAGKTSRFFHLTFILSAESELSAKKKSKYKRLYNSKYRTGNLVTIKQQNYKITMLI